MPCLGLTGELSESKQFEWKIADFLSLSTVKGAFYRSPSFVFDNTSLHLKIYPGSVGFSSSGYLSVFMVNETDCPLNLSYTLHIKLADGSLFSSLSGDVSLRTDWGYCNFYKNSNLELNKSELLPSDVLTIVCTLKRNQDGKQANEKADKVEMTSSDYGKLVELDVLSDNLRELSVNKDSCDVVLEVEDKEFKAHKAILIARSSVFAAMFQHDTLEKRTGFIKIPDCDSESFQEFLDYLYCGKLEKVSFRSAFHLYATSNKYDVRKLKEFCIKHMTKCLAPDNFCNIVKLADVYNDAMLITQIQHFFNENWNNIFPTTEWQTFAQGNFHLANKLLIEFSKTKNSQ